MYTHINIQCIYPHMCTHTQMHSHGCVQMDKAQIHIYVFTYVHTPLHSHTHVKTYMPANTLRPTCWHGPSPAESWRKNTVASCSPSPQFPNSILSTTKSNPEHRERNSPKYR